MTRCTWTPNDVALLRDLRVNKLLTFEEIWRCDLLPGRSVQSITCACFAKGMRLYKTPRLVTRSIRRTIRTLHGMGKSATEIGECVKLRRETVRKQLAAMNLKPNRWTQRHKDRLREGRLRWLERDGLASFGECTMVAFRRKVAATGWPIECKIRETQILDVLERHQHDNAGAEPRHGDGLNRLEVCQAAEINTSRTCIGEPYFGNLLRAGLIVRRGKRAVKPGQGNALQTYALAPGVKRKRLALPTTEERRIAEMELLRRVAG